jgi:hypothetical protein
VTEVSRDGDPVLIRGPQSGSLHRPNQYEVRTTPIPGEAWRGYFNSRFTGQVRFRGQHDGTKITIECSADDASKLTEVIDAAIEYANGK